MNSYIERIVFLNMRIQSRFGHLVLIAAATMLCAGIEALPQSSALQFEVATIKPHSLEQDRINGGAVHGGTCHGIDSQYPPGDLVAPPPLGRCVIYSLNLRGLVGMAYKMSIDGGPGWASSDMFDVEGKAEEVSSVTEAQLYAMLQNLLTDRFKLRYHQEERQVQGYEMYVGKSRPNLKEVASDDPPHIQFGPGAVMTAQHATMSYFANSLRGMAKASVVDKTGLTGAYDFSFQWIPRTLTHFSVRCRCNSDCE